MNNYLSVIKLKGQCTIQDLGRSHSQHLGFSGGGAADEYAFLSANKLLNNLNAVNLPSKNADLNTHHQKNNPLQKNCLQRNNIAALELTFGQITLKAHCHCTIAITGADCQATINQQPIQHWQVQQLKTGDELQLSLPRWGVYTYIAVRNGIQSTPWLGSQSQTINELALGFTGSAITQGSKIEISAEQSTPHCQNTNHSDKNSYTKAVHSYKNFYQNDLLTLRFIPSSLWQKLPPAIKQQFCETPYKVLPNSNRMGYRLSPLQGNAPLIIPTTLQAEKTLSHPVTYGAIQLPSSNEMIVLMKERQTIGGYPVLGSVMQTDLFRLSQKRSGEKVQFIPISLIQAQQQLMAFQQRFYK